MARGRTNSWLARNDYETFLSKKKRRETQSETEKAEAAAVENKPKGSAEQCQKGILRDEE